MREVCGKCVMVVDDDSSLRDLLSRELAKAGFESLHAEDGIDALVKLRVTLPKVIISDLMMPRMSGFEFIGVVRRRFPAIPVVALSGSIPNEFSEEIKPDCWFEKSMMPSPELLHTVDYLARNAPDLVAIPQVVSIPVRTRPGPAGDFLLTCTDCLRPFRATAPRDNKLVEGTTVCTHCEAHVPFLIENSAPE